MGCKINFINPFGTEVYDDLIRDTLAHYSAVGTELVVTHLEGCPPDPDYFYPKHMMEAALFERVMKSEQEGFDAVISGCCYDPGVSVSRELVNIPVVGPMEASLQMAAYFGRSVAIIADHRKACEYMRDHARVTGLANNIRGFEVIDWYIRDMIKDADAVANDVIEATKKTVEKTCAEAVILNCTIIAACYQAYRIKGGAPADVPVINPNLMALKMAESLADLHRKGAYEISRVGYYQQPHNEHYKTMTSSSRCAWTAARRAFVESFG
jgi:Asp/Glu/hydantoin racemase